MKTSPVGTAAILAAILAATLVGTVRSLYMNNRESKIEPDLVQVSFLETHLHDHRVRRSTDGDFLFPETLIFDVTVSNVTVTLVLELIDRHVHIPTVHVIDDDGNRVKVDVTFEEQFALYQDKNNGGAYRVACEGPSQDECSLAMHGSFYHRNNKYHMSPHETFAATGLHELARATEDHRDFTNDAVIPPDSVLAENRRDETSGARAGTKALPDANIVEVIAVCDESIWNAFRPKYNTVAATISAITQHYMLIMNAVDLHYLSVNMVDPSLSIRVALADINIAQSAGAAPWSSANTVTRDGTVYLNAANTAALNSFTSWKQQNIPTADHVMAFTMKDFESVYASSVTRGLAGQAWVGTVCGSSATSIVEDDGSRASNTAAHELGHGLRAGHDESSRCPTDDFNVMTPTTYTTTSSTKAEAQWTFSVCSTDAFKGYINGMWNNCLRDHPNLETTHYDAPLTLPGQVFNPDAQCKMRSGDAFRSCDSTVRVPASACYSGYRCDDDCAGRYFPHYPMAGTPCGNSGDDKWCYRGLCRDKPAVVTTQPPQTTQKVTTQPPQTTQKVTTQPPQTTQKVTAQPPQTTQKVTTQPPQTTQKVTTQPPQTTQKVTTQPPQTTQKVTTQPPQTTQKVTTQPPQTTQKVTTQPPQTTQKVTTQPPQTTQKVTTQPPQTTQKVTTQPPQTTQKVTTQPPQTTQKVTTQPPQTTQKVTTTASPTTSPPVNWCEETCFKVKKNGRVKKCTGKRCCRKRWGRKSPCCKKCQK